MFRRLLLATLGIVQLLSASYFDKENIAVISVPVANCLGKPAQDIDPSKKTEKFYEEFPCSPEKGSYSCARIHECLYNEVGIIKERVGDELLLEFPHFFYIDSSGSTASSFWIHKTSIIELEEYEDLKEVIPEPYGYTTQELLTLCQPWPYSETNQWYSVGTRFIRVPQKDTDTQYAVTCIDYKSAAPYTMLIDKEKTLTELPQSKTEAKKLFVALLQDWANKDEAIPYIWGGCSIGPRCTANEFICSEETRIEAKLTVWRRPNNPQYGCDCSGLVLRAAQLVGLNYFCKNTSTICHELSQVEGDLEEGDLLLMKGHVMVISSLENNTIIDAVSYSSGYGCVREVGLHEAFEGVATYNDLLEILTKHNSLECKDIDGNVISNRSDVTLVRL